MRAGASWCELENVGECELVRAGASWCELEMWVSASWCELASVQFIKPCFEYDMLCVLRRHKPIFNRRFEQTPCRTAFPSVLGMIFVHLTVELYQGMKPQWVAFFIHLRNTFFPRRPAPNRPIAPSWSQNRGLGEKVFKIYSVRGLHE